MYHKTRKTKPDPQASDLPRDSKTPLIKEYIYIYIYIEYIYIYIYIEYIYIYIYIY